MTAQAMTAAAGATVAARTFALGCGMALCVWALRHLSRRKLLVPSSLLICSIGAGLMLFACFPRFFDAIASDVGVKYPPTFYFALVVVALFGLILHLTARLSRLDMHCRRLTQEIAILSS